MSKRLNVSLTPTAKRPFTGHLVVASFTLAIKPVSGGKTLSVPSEISEPVDDGNAAILDFPDKVSLEESITARVVAPDGEVLIEVAVPVKLIDSNTPLTIEVDPKEYFQIEHNTDPAFGKPPRIRGLVVDPSGTGSVGNRQVVIYARLADPENAASEVVAVSRTDEHGYFSAKYPLGPFTEAQGSVSGGDPIPIKLDSEGNLPEKIILAIEPGSITEDECKEGECVCATTVPHDPDEADLVDSLGTYSADIGGELCVNITKPNRILEELDYYTVVRTTEPQIHGLTLDEPPKIDLSEIVRIVDPKIPSFMLTTKAAEVALEDTDKTEKPDASMRPELKKSMLSLNGKEEGDPEDLDNLASYAMITSRPALRELSEAIGLAALRMAGSRAGGTIPQAQSSMIEGIDKVRIETELVKTLALDPDGFSLTRLAQSEITTRKNDLLRVLDMLMRATGGRGYLTYRNSVDWDDDPTFYQACTLAHGHILHFKQQWVADGYSLGDLLYSLPLAPCQKKQVAIIDWDRRESAAREESVEAREMLAAQLSRDRDISDIAYASITENLSGGSKAHTWSAGVGGGIAGFIGAAAGVLGIGGGYSGASGKAWQKSSRDTAASSLQQLRDHTTQAASSIRSQRSTVIQTVKEGETITAQTEVVANHNHCHAMTMEYFEVLRHFLVRQNLADVQECLFVPLLMSRFDSAKALRWRDALSSCLIDGRHQLGFDALQRIADNYVGSDMPLGSYADEELENIGGYLRIQFNIRMPRDTDDGNYLPEAWACLLWTSIDIPTWWQQSYKGQQRRDRIFAETFGPNIAEEITNGLRFIAIGENDEQTILPMDVTLITDFSNNQPLYATLRLKAPLRPIKRRAIKAIKIDTVLGTEDDPKSIDDILPEGSKIIVHSGQMSYRTAHIAHDLFKEPYIMNDLSGEEGVLIYTPLSRAEMRNPRVEDIGYANSLLQHLNGHLEYYHRAIWSMMDAHRRYMLLDGFIAPNSGGRSVASVVENRIIGIVGNCLVMPVSPGFHLDPTFAQDSEKPIDLLEHYQPATPVAPLRLAIPTKGVFAEAVLGSCNSCEIKDESRFWRWEESPCPDEPAPIQPVGTESRRGETPDLTAQPLPQPLVAFQNVPSAPDPQGYAALLQLLSTPDIFRDVTGLTETQRNALAALQAAMSTAQAFGGKTADLAMKNAMQKDIDKVLKKIDEQYKAGAITAEQRAKLIEEALRTMISGGAQKQEDVQKNAADVMKIADELFKANILNAELIFYSCIFRIPGKRAFFSMKNRAWHYSCAILAVGGAATPTALKTLPATPSRGLLKSQVFPSSATSIS